MFDRPVRERAALKRSRAHIDVPTAHYSSDYGTAGLVAGIQHINIPATQVGLAWELLSVQEICKIRITAFLAEK